MLQEPAGRWHLSTWRDRVMASDMQAIASPSHSLRVELDFFIKIFLKQANFTGTHSLGLSLYKFSEVLNVCSASVTLLLQQREKKGGDVSAAALSYHEAICMGTQNVPKP